MEADAGSPPVPVDRELDSGRRPLVSVIIIFHNADPFLREAIDTMEGGSADAEHDALYSLATCVAELLDVSFDSYVSTTDTGEDDDDDT